MKEKDLFELKEQVDSAKTNVTLLQGEEKALLKQLKDNWGCSNIKEAQKKLESMQKNLETMESDFEKGLEELQEKYEIK